VDLAIVLTVWATLNVFDDDDDDDTLIITSRMRTNNNHHKTGEYAWAHATYFARSSLDLEKYRHGHAD